MSRLHRGLDRTLLAALRRAVLKRDNWRCQRCGKYGNECDHIVPLDKGGPPYDSVNAQTLCKGCHILKTREENTRHDPERERWQNYLAQQSD